MVRAQKWLVIWGAGILLILLAGLPAAAQTVTPDRANEFEITGTITALTNTSLTLNGITIQIAGAEIKDPVSVSTLVKVHYSVRADGVRVAREVEQALNPNLNDEFEITGVISALTSTTITIDNQVIQYANAEIKDPVTLGALVKVHYSVGANGAQIAREVELAQFTDRDDDNGGDNNEGNNSNSGSNSGSGNHNDDGDDDSFAAPEGYNGGNSGSGGGDDDGGNSGHGGDD